MRTMTADRSTRRGPARLSRTHRPPGLALESWQAELRREFGREQRFRLTNIGGERVFSEFEVVNPANGYPVRVAVGKSTRLNSSHVSISYAVFCLKKKKQLSQQMAV